MDILNIYLEKQLDKVLCDIAFHMAENPKYDGYQRTLPSMYYKLFDKKSTASYTRTGINSISDSEKQKQAEELHKPII